MNSVSAKEALETLQDGNARFARSQASHPHQSHERRADLSTGQQPFALILGCADSRIPPEIIFDQGIGDLFVIRVAGNIIDDAILGSIEYAVEHLGMQLIVVLGHENCGAVSATVQGGEAHGHIPTLIEAIRPAVDEAQSQGGDVLENATRTNARRIAKQIESSAPILAAATQAGTLEVKAAYYHLTTGKVEF
jgi:carbonic anhydrase